MMVVCVISKIKHYGLGPVNRSLLIDLQGLTPQQLYRFPQGLGLWKTAAILSWLPPKASSGRQQSQTQVFQHAEQICMASLAFIGTISYCPRGPARSKPMDWGQQPAVQICFKVLVPLGRFVAHRPFQTNRDFQGLNLLILLRDAKYRPPSMEINHMLESWK